MKFVKLIAILLCAMLAVDAMRVERKNLRKNKDDDSDEKKAMDAAKKAYDDKTGELDAANTAVTAAKKAVTDLATDAAADVKTAAAKVVTDAEAVVVAKTAEQVTLKATYDAAKTASDKADADAKAKADKDAADKAAADKAAADKAKSGCDKDAAKKAVDAATAAKSAYDDKADDLAPKQKEVVGLSTANDEAVKALAAATDTNRAALTTAGEAAKKALDDGNTAVAALTKEIADLKTAMDAAAAASKSAECSDDDSKAKAAADKAIFDALSPPGYGRTPEEVKSVPIANKWTKAPVTAGRKK